MLKGGSRGRLLVRACMHAGRAWNALGERTPSNCSPCNSTLLATADYLAMHKARVVPSQEREGACHTSWEIEGGGKARIVLTVSGTIHEVVPSQLAMNPCERLRRGEFRTDDGLKCALGHYIGPVQCALHADRDLKAYYAPC
jgi:hypothetical protein